MASRGATKRSSTKKDKRGSKKDGKNVKDSTSKSNRVKRTFASLPPEIVRMIIEEVECTHAHSMPAMAMLSGLFPDVDVEDVLGAGPEAFFGMLAGLTVGGDGPILPGPIPAVAQAAAPAAAPNAPAAGTGSTDLPAPGTGSTEPIPRSSNMSTSVATASHTDTFGIDGNGDQEDWENTNDEDDEDDDEEDDDYYDDDEDEDYDDDEACECSYCSLHDRARRLNAQDEDEEDEEDDEDDCEPYGRKYTEGYAWSSYDEDDDDEEMVSALTGRIRRKPKKATYRDGLPVDVLLPLLFINRTFLHEARSVLYRKVTLVSPWQASQFLRSLNAPMHAAFHPSDVPNPLPFGVSRNSLAALVRGLAIDYKVQDISLGRGGGQVFIDILKTCTSVRQLALLPTFLAEATRPLVKALSGLPQLRAVQLISGSDSEAPMIFTVPRIYRLMHTNWRDLEELDVTLLAPARMGPGMEEDQLFEDYYGDEGESDDDKESSRRKGLKTVFLTHPAIEGKELETLLSGSRKTLKQFGVLSPGDLMDRRSLASAILTFGVNLTNLTLEIDPKWHPIVNTGAPTPFPQRPKDYKNGEPGRVLTAISEYPHFLDCIVPYLRFLVTIKWNGLLASSALFATFPKTLETVSWTNCPTLHPGRLTRLLAKKVSRTRKVDNTDGSKRTETYQTNIAAGVKCITVMKDDLDWKQEDIDALDIELNKRDVCLHLSSTGTLGRGPASIVNRPRRSGPNGGHAGDQPANNGNPNTNTAAPTGATDAQRPRPTVPLPIRNPQGARAPTGTAALPRLSPPVANVGRAPAPPTAPASASDPARASAPTSTTASETTRPPPAAPTPTQASVSTPVAAIRINPFAAGARGTASGGSTSARSPRQQSASPTLSPSRSTSNADATASTSRLPNASTSTSSSRNASSPAPQASTSLDAGTGSTRSRDDVNNPNFFRQFGSSGSPSTSSTSSSRPTATPASTASASASSSTSQALANAGPSNAPGAPVEDEFFGGIRWTPAMVTRRNDMIIAAAERWQSGDDWYEGISNIMEQFRIRPEDP